MQSAEVRGAQEAPRGGDRGPEGGFDDPRGGGGLAGVPADAPGAPRVERVASFSTRGVALQGRSERFVARHARNLFRRTPNAR